MKDPREDSGAGRFELVCEAFNRSNELQRKRMLEMLDEADRKQFLIGCGLYRLYRDQRLYKAVQTAIGEEIWREAHKEQD